MQQQLTLLARRNRQQQQQHLNLAWQLGARRKHRRDTERQFKRSLSGGSESLPAFDPDRSTRRAFLLLVALSCCCSCFEPYLLLKVKVESQLECQCQLGQASIIIIDYLRDHRPTRTAQQGQIGGAPAARDCPVRAGRARA